MTQGYLTPFKGGLRRYCLKPGLHVWKLPMMCVGHLIVLGEVELHCPKFHVRGGVFGCTYEVKGPKQNLVPDIRASSLSIKGDFSVEEGLDILGLLKIDGQLHVRGAIYCDDGLIAVGAATRVVCPFLPATRMSGGAFSINFNNLIIRKAEDETRRYLNSLSIRPLWTTFEDRPQGEVERNERRVKMCANEVIKASRTRKQLRGHLKQLKPAQSALLKSLYMKDVKRTRWR